MCAGESRGRSFSVNESLSKGNQILNYSTLILEECFFFLWWMKYPFQFVAVKTLVFSLRKLELLEGKKILWS